VPHAFPATHDLDYDGLGYRQGSVFEVFLTKVNVVSKGDSVYVSQ
jgi:hypothetical protein